MNHQLRLVSFSFVLSLIFAFPANAAPLELDELRQQHHKAIVAPYETARTELDAKFGAALGNAEAAAKQGGRLDEVIAIQADRKRLAEKIPFPENDESTPASVARLRTIYREQLAQLEVKLAAAQAEILPAYTAKLQELEATLTKADRIADALAVKAYREGLGKGTAPLVTSTLPAAPELENDKKIRLSKFKNVEEFSAWLHTTEWKNEAGTKFSFPEPNVLETNKNGAITLYTIKIPDAGVVTWVYPSTGATNTMQVASDLRTATCDNAPALERIVSE